MALTDGEGMNTTMLVSPTGGMAGNGFGNGFGGDWAWIILLLLLGWGNNGFGGGYGGFNNQLGYDFPWLINGQQGINANTNAGFQNAMLNDNLTGIRDSITGISTQLCNGFAGIEQGANTRQIANMQSMNALQSQLAQCCCDNRLASADLKYTIATENCADRAALSDGIRDLLAATQAQTQTILTQLCNDKIEQKNDTINQLRAELLYARGQASQDVQTAELRANNATVANQLLAEMRSCPIPAQPVYGNTPIFTCSGGCGCTGTV